MYFFFDRESFSFNYEYFLFAAPNNVKHSEEQSNDE